MSDIEKKHFHQMAEKDKRSDAEIQNCTPLKGRRKRRSKKRKRNNDNNASKGSLSAFFKFCNDEREKIKMLNPEFGVGDIAKELSKKWSNANPETKSKYEAMAEKEMALFKRTMPDNEDKRSHEMAEKEKKRSDTEMQNNTPRKRKRKRRSKKHKHIEDKNASKGSLSAFFKFCNDERGKVKMLNPEFGVGDIAKELGKKWSDADPETKSKYEAMAEQDKARYEREMTAYKEKMKDDAPVIANLGNIIDSDSEDEYEEDDE